MIRPRHYAIAAVLLPVLLAPMGPVLAQNEPAVVRPAAPVVSPDRKLGAGDLVTYRVMEDRDPAVQLIVTDTGELDVPYLGRVRVSGRSVSDATASIKSALEKEYYHTATVLLGIDQIARTAAATSSGMVYLSGQVRTPGPQPLNVGETNTAGKVILRAGGLTDFADDRRVKIVRRASENAPPQNIVVDLKEVLEKGRVEKDVELRDGDMIIVSQKAFNW